MQHLAAHDFYPRPPRGGRLFIAMFRYLPAGISIHALREEGDYRMAAPEYKLENFYPRPPRGGRRVHCALVLLRDDFYPRPPRGGRQGLGTILRRGIVAFLSTPSARRATLAGRHQRSTFANFYPRPPRGGRPQRLRRAPQLRRISIHALREEGDRRQGRSQSAHHYFYPRPPRGGRRRR